MDALRKFKKFAAITLSSLGILVSAPSALCGPKVKVLLPQINSIEKDYNATAPARTDNELKFSSLKSLGPLPPLSLNSHAKVTKRNHVNPITNNYLEPNFVIYDDKSIDKLKYSWAVLRLKGIIAAPLARPKVSEKAFLNQVDMTTLFLPLVSRIDEYAFEGCRNLNMLFLTSNIESVSPMAFARCNRNLKIVYHDSIYTIPQFLSMFASIEENATTYNYAVNSDEETLSFFNFAKR